ILMTLGQTPQWASKTPGVEGLYGMGASGAPANMEYWRDYVRTLARRYAGRIRYWELWNEPDFQQLYNGSIADMVEMARIARQELKAADPENRLISPGLTTAQGLAWLHRFLSAGGGRYVDAIGFHWYFGDRPESIGAFIDNVHTLLRQHGQDDKPLWNTEGGLNVPRS
ncbi:glycosyl hydrolase, partial [Cutibacterium acnes]